MGKKRIIYSLTNRGLFSELSNLALAIVYAEINNFDLIVNSRNWNARFNKGMADYFEPCIPERSDFYTSQLKIYTQEKPWIGNIYYNPKFFFKFYSMEILNSIYAFFYPKTIYSKDIFPKMYNKNFIDNILGTECFQKMSYTFKQIYQYNEETAQYICRRKRDLNIPDKYISVHIRRGDKITTGEMNDILLDKYMDEIKKLSDYYKDIYIATDDKTIIPYFAKELKEIGLNLYYNKFNMQEGFVESKFNTKSKQAIKEETLNMLFDMDMMIQSSYFIGTYSSNIGRIIPLYLGLANCKSLDIDWNILYK